MDLQVRSQNLIKDTLGLSENLERVRLFLDEEAPPNRTALASQVCDWYGFLDHRGQRQISTCLKALRLIISNAFVSFQCSKKEISKYCRLL